MSTGFYTSAGIRIDVDTKDFNKIMGTTGASTEKVLNNMKANADAFSASWGDLTSGIKDTKRIVSGILVSQAFYAISNVLAEAATSVLSFSQNMETAGLSFEYFVKGADKAAKSLAFIREMQDFAAKTPFSTEDSLSLSKYMQAMGVGMGSTKSFLTVITDTAAATGATEQNLQRITFGLGQMLTKGRLANEEIRQLANANIPIYEILQEQLGLTGEQISKIGTEWVSADKAVVAILDGLEQRYGGASKRLSETVTGMLDTVKDNALIIAQTAGGGAFDTFASKLATLRDALERYRATVMQTGSTGLFRQMLLDIDSTGALGTQILALLGNFRQLGSSVMSLARAASPLISMFKDSLYASVSAFSYALTITSRAATSLISTLDKLGITSGGLGRVLASLYITYKVGSWIAFLGQGAVSAAYSVVGLTKTMWSLVPATATASTGVKLLTTGVIGGLAAFLAFNGILSMVNNSLAGLDATASGTSVLPDDFSAAYAEYEKKMKEYNDAIAKYQESFNDPYDTLADDASNAFGDVEDESTKSAKKVKQTWLATFDEVFSVPEKDAADAMPKMPDFGSMLMLPTLKFPTRGNAQLTEPKFDWKDVFSGSPLDNIDPNVLDSNWWSNLLFTLVPAFVIGMGNWFAKNRPVEPGKTPGASSGGSIFGADKTVSQNTTALRNASESIRKYTEIAKAALDKLIKDADNQQAVAALRDIAPKLDKQIAEANKISALLGKDVEITSETLTAVRQQLGIADVKQAIAQYNEGKLDLGGLEKVYNKVSEVATGNAEFIRVTKGLGLSVEEKFLQLITLTAKVSTEFRKLNVSASQLPNGISFEEYTKELVAANAATMTEITRLYTAIQPILLTEAADTSRMVGILREIADASKTLSVLRLRQRDAQNTLQNTTALKVTGRVIDTAAVEKELATVNTSIKNTGDRMLAKLAALEVLDEDTTKELGNIQKAITNGDRFRNLTTLISTRFAATYNAIKALEQYPKEVIFMQHEGIALFSDISRNLASLAESIPVAFKEISFLLIDTKASILDISKSHTVPASLSSSISDKLARALYDAAQSLGLSTDITSMHMQRFSDALGKQTGVIEDIDKAIAELNSKPQAAPKPRKTANEIFEVIDVRLQRIAANAKDIDAYDNAIFKLIGRLEKEFPAELIALRQNINADFEVARKSFIVDLAAPTAAKRALDAQMILPRAVSQEVKELRNNILKIRALTEKIVGEGISIKDAVPAAYVSDAIREAGLFDPGRVAMSGTDVAGATGISGYGTTYLTSIIDNMLSSAIDALGLPKQLHTIATIMRMTQGAELESLILAATDSKLKGTGKSLSTGDIFFDAFRRMQVQLDSLVWKDEQFVAALDAKALQSSEKIANILSLGVKDTDGIYKILPDKFNELIKYADDIAYQLALQSVVMGTQTAYLSILDVSGFGAKLDSSKYAMYNPTNSKHVDTVKRMTAEDTARYAVTKSLNEVAEHISIIEVTIPEAIKEFVADLSDKFYLLQDILSKLRIAGMDMTKILKPINKNLKIMGELSHKRYERGNFNAPNTPSPELNTILRDIVQQLKSNRNLQQEMGMTRLDDLVDKLLNAAYDNTGELRQRIVSIPQYFKNDALSVKLTGTEMLDVVRQLREFKDLFASRSTAVAISLHDQIAQLNKIADKMPALTDTVSASSNTTVKDLLYSIKKTAQQLEDISGSDAIVSNQISSMLNRGTISPITNPFDFASVGEITDALIAATKNGATAADSAAFTQAIVNFTSTLTQAEQKNIAGSGSVYDPSVQGAVVKDIQFMQDLSNFFKNIFEKLSDKFFTSGKANGYTSMPDAGGRYTEVYTRTFFDDFFKVMRTRLRNVADEQPLASVYKAGTDNFNLTSGKNVGSGLPEWASTVSKYVIPAALIATTIGLNVKDALDTKKSFEQNVLKYLDTDQQTSATQRSNSINNVQSAVVGKGFSVDEFFAKYSEMTDLERVFWGKLAASKQDAYSPFTDGLNSQSMWQRAFNNQPTLDALYDSSRNLPDAMLQDQKVTRGITNIDDESTLRRALEDGIDNSSLAAAVDYFVKSGDTTSYEAKEFYKRYGKYVETVVKPAYGMDNDWYANVDYLLSKYSESINKDLNAAGFGSITDSRQVTLQLKGYFDSLMQSMTDSVQKPMVDNMEAFAKFREDNLGGVDVTTVTDAIKAGFELRNVDTSGLSTDLRTELKDSLGMTVQTLSDSLSGVSFDMNGLADNIVGWVEQLPANLNLGDISVSDATILASAGIQINSDGTITFMKPLDLNASGSDRDITLKSEDISQAVLDALTLKGLTIDFSNAEASLDISDLDKLIGSSGEGMYAALFQMSNNLAGQISDAAANSLSSLGTVLDSGYFKLTNSSVLAGTQTAQGYLEGLGYTFDSAGNYVAKSGDVLSGEIITMLQQVDKAIAQGGSNTAKTVATWADGIVIKSPVTKESLTDEMEAAFAAAGITFQEYGDEFYATINKVGEQWKDGITKVSADSMSQLSPSIRAALEDVGVIFDGALAEQTGFWTVQLPDVTTRGIDDLVSLYVDNPAVWDKLPAGFKTGLEQFITTTDTGLAEIKMHAGLGLENLGNEWYQFWDTLPQATTDALIAAAANTSQGTLDIAAAAKDGLMKIELVTANTTVPDNLNDYVIVPFNSLPDEIRTSMGSAASELEGQNVIITDATTTAFAGMKTTIDSVFEDVAYSADEGANNIANAVKRAMEAVARLSSLSVNTNWNPFDDDTKPSWSGMQGAWKVTYGGKTYKSSAATKEQAIADIFEKYGVSIPAYKNGGIITADGLYRAGEFGMKEAVVPLENPRALNLIGSVLSDSMMQNVSQNSQIALDYVLQSGSAGIARQSVPQQQEQVSSADDMAKALAEVLLPALVSTNADQDSRPIVYVENMIATDEGIHQLDEKIRIVRLKRGEPVA